MNDFEKQLDRIKQVNRLCRLKFRGDAETYAERLGISRSQFYRLLDLMRRLGFPIQYNADAGFYYFEEEVEFVFEIKHKPSELKSQ
jgi:predicted DNA-binding transcriptional regulator YafY